MSDTGSQIEDEKRWREGLERLGRDEVVRILATPSRSGSSPGASVTGVVTSDPFPSRAFVVAWADERRRAKQRFKHNIETGLVWGAVAMFLVTSVSVLVSMFW